jgi:WD40 repeat protein
VVHEGEVLASAENKVALWDVNTGKERGAALGHKNEVCGVVVSADGKWVGECSVVNTIATRVNSDRGEN